LVLPSAIFGAPVPSGTVTFLFTDIEDSMRQWQAAPDPMRLGLERHDSKVRDAVDACGGSSFDRQRRVSAPRLGTRLLPSVWSTSPAGPL
jgi:class 3 adenylate cyclase